MEDHGAVVDLVVGHVRVVDGAIVRDVWHLYEDGWTSADVSIGELREMLAVTYPSPQDEIDAALAAMQAAA